MSRTAIQFLVPGQRFALACDPDVRGTVLRKSDCSVTVKVSGGVRDVDFEDPATGEKRNVKFEGGRTTNWSPNTEVLPGEIGRVPRDDEPATRGRRVETAERGPGLAPTPPGLPDPGPETPNPDGEAPAAPVARRVQAASTPEGGKMSALDAAEKVLGEAGTPLTAKELVEQMAAKGYWSSPGGKTPHATLNSAIMREIKNQGDVSRFAKHPEGGFTLSIL